MTNELTSKWIFIALAAVLLGAVLWKYNYLPFGRENTYQAVFLTNNQVYFGKLSRPKSDWPVLRDIFYLQVTQNLQPQNPAQPSPQFQLAKLGTELHGPQDEMRLSRDQILFVEDLKPDSQVVRAILEYKQNQGK